jgi:hypothetical protein
MRYFLIIGWLCLGFVILAQSEEVKLEIKPQKVEVGQTFTVIITSSVHGTFDVENIPSSFIQDLGISQGSQEEIDYNTGVVRSTYYYSFTGMISKPGKYTIGPAFVKNNNKVYQSNKVTVDVSSQVSMGSGQITQKQLNDPAFGVIEVNKKEIYEGEPVLIAAKIYSHYEPSHISGYQSCGLNGTVIKHPIGSLTNAKIFEERLQGQRFYTLNYDKNVVFPDGVGSFQIDPFKVNLHQGYKSFPITSSSLIVKVNPLPGNAPSDFMGGVGTFEMSVQADTNKVKQGDVFKYSVVLTGQGNLHNLIEPKLKLPKGFIIYGDPITEENFTFSTSGANGEVRYEYNVQATRSGSHTLDEMTITYFDPKREEYITLESKSLSIEVEKNKNFTPPVEEETTGTETLVIRDLEPIRSTSSINDNHLYGSPLFWGGIGFPILSSIFFLLFTANKSKREEDREKKINQKTHTDQLNTLIAEAKVLAATDSSDYYTKILSVLQLAFAIKLNKVGTVLSKQEILNCSFMTQDEMLKKRVSEVYDKCEAAKYGFGGNWSDREDLIMEVQEINKKLGL